MDRAMGILDWHTSSLESVAHYVVNGMLKREAGARQMRPDAISEYTRPEILQHFKNAWLDRCPNPTKAGQTWLVVWEGTESISDPRFAGKYIHGQAIDVPMLIPTWDAALIVAPAGMKLQRGDRPLVCRAADLDAQDRELSPLLIECNPVLLTAKTLKRAGPAMFWFDRLYWVVTTDEGVKRKPSKKGKSVASDPY